jgi:hypothetical protein
MDEEVKQGFQCLRELIKEDFDKVYELFDSILTSAFDPNIITSFLSNKISLCEIKCSSTSQTSI